MSAESLTTLLLISDGGGLFGSRTFKFPRPCVPAANAN